MRRRRPANPPPQLDLGIGELHLHGFALEHREAFVAALRRELARLVEGRGLPATLPHGGTTFALDQLRFDAAADSSPSDAAAGAARMIYDRLRGTGA